MWWAEKELGFKCTYFDSFLINIYIGHREAWLNDARLVESEYSPTITVKVSSWGPQELASLRDAWRFRSISSIVSDVYTSEYTHGWGH
jgi:hypothetical protein